MAVFFVVAWRDPRDVHWPSFAVIIGLVLSPPTISFIGNQIWADDQLGDLCACVGSGNLALAMSQHPQLGRDSWLGVQTPLAATLRTSEPFSLQPWSTCMNKLQVATQ